jgi:hypothetical protein
MLTRKEFLKFMGLMRRPRPTELLPEMCLDVYLGAVSHAYAAIFLDPDWLAFLSRHTRFDPALLQHEGITPASLPTCSPLLQYRSLANGRHGGLLDLSPADPDAFSQWYFRRAKIAHYPYEVVAGDDAHGIMLRAVGPFSRLGGWHLEMTVHAPQLYELAVRMSLALEGARVPFKFRDHEKAIGGLVLRRHPATGQRL